MAVTDAPPGRARPTGPAGQLALAVRDRPFLVAVAAAVLLSLFAVTAFTPYYETNDDTTMNLIAAGVAFADRPDEHLVFTNVLIGLPLRQLYLAAPHVPWYGLYQFAALAAAAAALTYAFLRVNPSVRQAGGAALFLVLAVLPCLVEVQFTRTASLASFAGLALLLAPLCGAANWPRLADVTGCLLLVLGSLIRFESFLLAGVVFLPVIAVAAYAAPRPALRRAVPLAVSLAAAVGLYFVNLGYYAREEGWKDFYAYNAVRARFTDYKRYWYVPETKPAFDAAGWQQVDYWMLMNWFFADRERYSLAKLQAISATVPAAPLPSVGYVSSVVLSNLPGFPSLIQMMLAGAVISLLTGGGWRRLVLPVVLFGFVFVVVIAMGVAGFWVPTRVAISLFAGALAGTILRAGAVAQTANRRQGSGSAIEVTAVAVSIGLAAWAVVGLIEPDLDRVRRHSAVLEAVGQFKPRPEQLYVVWADAFPFEYSVMPLEDPAALRPFRCLSMSWLLPTPLTDRRMEDFGVTDVYRAVCEQPNVYLVAFPPLIDQFRHYVFVHYGKAVILQHKYDGKSVLTRWLNDKRDDRPFLNVFRGRVVPMPPGLKPPPDALPPDRESPGSPRQ